MRLRDWSPPLSALGVLAVVLAAWALALPATAQEDGSEAAVEATGSAGDPAEAPPVPPPLSAQKQKQIRAIEQKIDAAQRYLELLGREIQRIEAAPDTPAPPVPLPVPPPRQVPTGSGAESVPPPPPRQVPTGSGAGSVPPPPPRQTRSASDTAPRPPTTLDDEEEDVEGPSREQELPEFTPEFLAAARAVLIPRGFLETNIRVNYSHNDLNTLSVRGLDIVEAIFVGTFEVGKIRRDSIATTLGVRYGLADRLQFNLTVPYRFRYTKNYRPPDIASIPEERGDERNSKNSGWGDMEFGLSYHLVRESNWWPDTIATVGIKANNGEGPFDTQVGDAATGTGFWGIRPGVTLVKVTDPGSIFATVSYFYHIEDEIRPGLKFDPSDTVGGSIGFALALNPFFSINIAGLASYAFKLQVNDLSVPGSDQVAASIAIGGTYGIARNRSIDASFTFGLTEEAPDFAIRFGLPMRWNLNPYWRRIKWEPGRKFWSVVTAPFNFKSQRGNGT